MAKQLVRRDNVEQFIRSGEQTLYVDQTMLLTPGAKDYLREKGISVVYAAQPAAVPQPEPKAETETRSTATDPDLPARIGELLKKDFSITDCGLITEVTRKVMERLRIHQ